jgi:hypothetical protein
MKQFCFLSMTLALVLAAIGAFAGTATFSGSTGDQDAASDAELANVTYHADGCSFTLAAGDTEALSDHLLIAGAYPDVDDATNSVDFDFVWNGAVNATDFAGLDLGLFEISGVFPTELGRLSLHGGMDFAQIVLVPAGGTQVVLAEATGLSEAPTVFSMSVAASTLTFDYGAGSLDLDLTSVDTLGDLTGATHFMVVNLFAAGADFEFNTVTWAGDAVPDVNQGTTGCDQLAVPNVVGQDETDAIATIDAVAGLSYDAAASSTDYSDDYPLDTVVSQTPVAGTHVTASVDTVGIVVSLGSTDGDNDDLLDQWEMDNFGDLDEGKWDDPDNDGAWNVKEQNDGTDPNDPTSLLPIATSAGLMIMVLLLCAAAMLVLTRRKGISHDSDES